MSAPAYAYKTAGSIATGTGAVVPGMPATAVAGNLLVLYTGSRNNTDTVTALTGYTLLFPNTHMTWGGLYGRIMVGGDTAPTVTWSGTNAHQAQIAAFGGSVYTDLTTIVTGNVDKSGTNVDSLYSALAISAANQLCFAAMLHNKTVTSDGTSVNDLLGWTRIGNNTPGGNSTAFWWGFQLQTTAASLTTATQTRTGAAENLQYGTMYASLQSAAPATHVGAIYAATSLFQD